jgi:urease accessory protein
LTIQVQARLHGGRHQVRMVSGLLRAQLLQADGEHCRVGLLASTALLLGGDEVELEVEVGAGATLDLFDVAATVAYSGRGQAAAWRTRIRVAENATLRYASEPLIVCDGAEVTRSTSVEMDPGGELELRETVVLGRSGEVGGPLRSRMHLRVAGEDVWVEDQVLDAADGRSLPGMLGEHRVLDTVLNVGPVPAGATPGAVRFTLPYGRGSVSRYLGSSLAASPLVGQSTRQRKAVSR